MLDNLASILTATKAKDLLRRIEHKNTATALAAEAELSLLWAMSTAAHLAIEPELSDGRRPDAASDDLFPSGPSVIEITALSDDTFSGKEAMDRTANKLVALANRIRKGAGHNLGFEFLDKSFWRNGRYHRVRCVAPDFEVTPYFESGLRTWLSSLPDPQSSIRLSEGETDVVITWHSARFHPHARRTFCCMPPVTYDAEDNLLYKALEKKAARLRRVPETCLRCVFLFDVGCDLLKRLRPMGGVSEISGEQILQHALANLRLDIICVVSADRDPPKIFHSLIERRPYWRITYIDRRQNLPSAEYDGLKRLAGALPCPRYEPYQTRALHIQRQFDVTKPEQHLDTEVIMTASRTRIKVSARLIQELLAGTITSEEFQEKAFRGEANPFEAGLKRGEVIARIDFEVGGIDQDDDHAVFDLEPDFAILPLVLPRGRV